MNDKCDFCHNPTGKSIGQLNRARKEGLKIFCNRKCFGLSKRKNKTEKEKKEEKRLYDIEYRKKNVDRLKKQKAEYFKKDYAAHPEKYKEIRRKNYHKHLEYLSTSKYKQWKKEYDKRYRAKKNFGVFAECQLILQELSEIVPSKKAKYDLGLINKSQIRKRNYEKFKCSKFKGSLMGYPK